jgi:hypothetical protein
LERAVHEQLCGSHAPVFGPSLAEVIEDELPRFVFAGTGHATLEPPPQDKARKRRG